ncbi:sulfotransferase family protein [Seongchinamella unica]|uniref:Sulfotransferase family protein n=1 Tax=Seongchinamella unica TaxID=2547392 RepID=A0A4R5LWQ3_9GAMM|nr:sulfotransferase [Seongchinamella unica]TDG15871.1 sulfotransferase family protein [Seongchinamella unica]
MKQRPRPQKLTSLEQSQLAEAQRLFDGGHFAPARELCARLLSRKPRAPEPLLLQAWICAEEADFFAAQQAVERAAALLPTDPGVQAWAAQLCSDAGDLRAAETYEQQALKLQATDPAALRSLAASFTNAERYLEALPCYQRLLQLEPWSVGNCMNVAYSARFAGDMALAEKLLLEVLDHDPGFFQAQFALSQLRTADPGQNHIDWFEASLAANRDKPQARSFLGYALGKEYEDLGDFERAFDRYSLAADSVSRNRKQVQADIEVIHRLREQSSALPAVPDGEAGQGMVFIIGLPRTGTTLLDRILGGHSCIENSGELLAFPFSTHRCLGLTVRGAMSSGLLDKLAGLDYDELGRAYLACLPQRLLQTGFMTDKNPINFLYAGLIARALPAAKIIHIRRHPMDSCFSNFKQLFAPGAYLHSYDLPAMAAYYSAYSALAELWQDTLGDRYLEVCYEDLVVDYEREARRLLASCGLDWEDGIRQFFARRSSVGSASFAQVRQPVYSTSVARWRQFESQLQPLRQALLDQGIPESALA